MSSLPLKVLFVTSSYPRADDDTAAVFLKYLAEHLADKEVEVHVLAPAESQGNTVAERNVIVHRFQYLPAAMQKLAYGSGIVPNLQRSPSLWLQVPFFLMAMTCSLLRLLTRQRFDVIHAHWLLPQGLAGLIAARIFNIPLIITAHGTDAFALQGQLFKRLKRLILTGCAAWTTNTTATAGAVIRESRLPEPKIIPMGVNLALFCNGNRAALHHDLIDTQHVVLFVGRLIENKGCQDVIEAFARLSSNIRLQTKLWIVGVGNQRTQLERAAQKLGVEARVKFFGAVEQKRLADIYAAADLVVVPSKLGSAGEAEGQSVVVLEAFAARACVLATRVGGIPSMVRHQVTGILVAPGSPKALSEGLELLVNDSALRLQLSEKAFAEIDQYSWERVAGEFHRLYVETVNAVSL